MRKKILVVDDNRNDYFAYKRFLSKEDSDYSLLHAKCIDEAIEKLKLDSYYCVLLDYNLPDQSGIDFLRHLSTEDVSLPVVMLTGEGDESIAVEAMKLGAQNYINKACATADVLSASIEEAICAHEQHVTEVTEAKKNLHLAFHDKLTNLPNRALLLERLNLLIGQSQRRDSNIAVLFIDLDCNPPILNSIY